MTSLVSSSLKHLHLDLHPTAASHLAGIGFACCLPELIRSETVIAFPKTGGGHDPLTGAPTQITSAQRKEAGIDSTPTKPDATSEETPETSVSKV